MQNKKCLERCLELIRDKRYRELSAILAEQNPVDLADLLEAWPQNRAALAFRTLPKEQAAEVFSNLPPDTQQMIVVSLPDRELAASWRSWPWTTRWICWRSCPPAWSSGC